MNITDLTVPGVWRCPKCQFTQVNQTWKEHAAGLEKMLDTVLNHQCNTVISRVEFVHGGMGPDTVLVSIITGQVLQIGLEGVNLYETRGSLELCAEPLGGLVFPR